jgi:hypothetical protein
MNALAITVRDLTLTLERAAHDGTRRLKKAVAIYGNDFSDKQKALDAFAAGRPAYWTTVSYHAVRAVSLMIAVNRGVEILAALESEYRHCSNDQKLAALDTLVPLNAEAAEALSQAYARFGLWRDAEELEMRRVRNCRGRA